MDFNTFMLSSTDGPLNYSISVDLNPHLLSILSNLCVHAYMYMYNVYQTCVLLHST